MDTGITQNLHFLFPLREVYRVQILPFTRVATDFCNSGRQLRQQAHQRFHRNPFRVSTTFSGLAVKPPTVLDVRAALAKRNTELAGRFQRCGPHGFPPMQMLVRIDVGGFAAHQVTKHLELAGHLLPYRKQIVERHHVIEKSPVRVAVNPFAEVHV